MGLFDSPKSYRGYVYVEGPEGSLKTIKVKARWAGVPYKAVFKKNKQGTPNWMKWSMDDMVAKHDLKRIEDEHARMKIKFEEARKIKVRAPSNAGAKGSKDELDSESESESSSEDEEESSDQSDSDEPPMFRSIRKKNNMKVKIQDYMM